MLVTVIACAMTLRCMCASAGVTNGVTTGEAVSVDVTDDVGQGGIGVRERLGTSDFNLGVADLEDTGVVESKILILIIIKSTN